MKYRHKGILFNYQQKKMFWVGFTCARLKAKTSEHVAFVHVMEHRENTAQQ